MNFEDTIRRAKKEWEASKQKTTILVGAATCGISAGALETIQAFEKELKSKKIEASLTEVGCMGLCYAEPTVIIQKPGRPGVCYGETTPEKARELVERYLINDDPAPDYAIGSIGEGNVEGVPNFFETPGQKLQVRNVLRNCGFINPTRIDHYLAKDGYSGLTKALGMSPEEIIEEVKKSGVRGRGGAGFPAWKKWSFCRDADGDKKYIICNADEGDPGAFMNRSLLEGDPHSVLEGMLIAGRAIGSDSGVIYCRAEYPLALERLGLAIKQMKEHGLLGDNILGSDFSFNIKIKEGAGAFVCGEETALIASIEGKRGMPSPRPPFPAVSGLWGKPTIINNVETLGNIALILKNGADWYAGFGTETNKGTKTFALAGKIKRTGLVEVPFGLTLKQMVYEIGGGILNDKAFKAIQTGGPSGGCIPAELLDTPVDYESLTAAGSIMGSGGMVVMDEDTCMVDVARYFLDFSRKESCGECVPCRLGSTQMLNILEDITNGKGRPGDIELLSDLSEGIKTGSLCGLGQTAPNPALTTIRYFRNEYEDHINRQKCPAAVCREIISAPCQHTCPIGTEATVYISLIAQGRFEEAWEVIRKDNPLPSVCARVCHHPCESKCQSGRWGESVAVRSLKRAVSDYAVKNGIYNEPETPTKSDKGKVAIIGAGPAGLTAGYYLAKNGYEAEIFEALDIPGGALAVCIPEYRLPRGTLDLDIQNIKNAGVKIKTGVKVGTDISFDELVKNHQAVFIAAGSHKSKKLRIENEDVEGVLDSMKFLKDTNLEKPLEIAGHIGVIGGGNSAVDAARSAVRMKDCQKVTIIYRRTKAEMPAFQEEIEAAEQEGIEIRILTSPSRVIAKDGKLAGLECVKMELGEIDESGRRRPVPKKDSKFVIELDALIAAIGEEPDLGFLDEKDNIKLSWNTIEADPETFATNIPGVFAGGDVVTGPATVVEAMAAGKIVSEMIDKHIRGEEATVDHKPSRPSMYLPAAKLTEEEIEDSRRLQVPCLSVNDRINNFNEVDLSVAEAAAIREAKRCLRCDLETEEGKKCLSQTHTSGEK